MAIKKTIFWAVCTVFLIAALVFNADADSETITYQYDALERLNTIDYGSTSIFYIYDNAGNRITRTVYPSGSIENDPPDEPTLLSPSNGAIEVNPQYQLSWSGSDPNQENKLTYSVYLGEDSELVLIKSGIYENSYTIGPLKPKTTYYWQIEARDNFNATTTSAIYSFETGNQAPNVPTIQFPDVDAQITYQNAYLKWSCNDPDIADTLVYDIYFGTSDDPPLLQSNSTEAAYDVGTLDPGAVYYWRIVAKDLHGAQTSSPVWSFNTTPHASVVLSNETYDVDTVLTKAGGPYIVEGNMTVAEGTTLTIEPGTLFKMGANAQLIVYGTLIAQGTANNKIIFTSQMDDTYLGDTNGDGYQSSPYAGAWSQIYFTSSSQNSLFEYVDILYAGYGTTGRAIYINNAAPTIANCTIRYSQGDGINVQSGDPQITENTIGDCGRYGVYIASGTAQISGNNFTDITDYDLYIANGTGVTATNNTLNFGLYVGSGILTALTGNTLNYDNSHPPRLASDDVGPFLVNNTVNNVTAGSYIEVTTGTISRDALWPSTFAYHIVGNIAVQGTDGDDGITTLTIAPGTELRFNKNQRLTIGSSSGDPGALSAIGTEADPILFSSNCTPRSAGDWQGIHFYTTADDTATVLEHCIIQYAGYSASGNALNIYNSSPTISQCTIRHSQGDGLFIHSYTNDTSPTITNCTIRYCQRDGIYVQSGNPQITDNTISNCGRYGVNIDSGTAQISGNNFADITDYDLYISIGTGVAATNNTLNSGIYVGSGIMATLSGNTLNYDNGNPLRLAADDVGPFLVNNTVNSVTADSYIEVAASTISRDALWPSTFSYHIVGYITVQGTDGDDGITTLTIAPGTELRFNQSLQLNIGATSSDPGALSAIGTESDPILFTSNRTPQSAGDWRGIYFYTTADDATTVLEHCVIEYAGYGTTGNAIHIYNDSPAIKHCTIRHSQGYGIYASLGSPVIEGNTLANNGNYDIYLASVNNAVITSNTTSSGLYVNSGSLAMLVGNTINLTDTYPLRLHPDSVGELFSANTLNNVTADSHIEVIGGTISRDATWPALIAYHIKGSITVKGSDGADSITTLTIEPDAQLKFDRSTQMNIGAYSGDPGALVAQGTAENPIVMTSNQAAPAAGDWYGINFYNTTDDATTALEHCTIEYAGYGTSSRAIYVYNASPTTANCTIRHSQGDGIYVQSGDPQITANTIGDCGRYGVYVASGAAEISNNSFVNITNYDIYISNGAGLSVTGNTLSSGIYVNSGILTALTGNTLNYDDSHPLRLGADDVGPFLANNTVDNVTAESYIEVITGTISRDATWPALMAYHIKGNITVKGTDGDDGITTLTIAPAAQLKFDRYKQMYIGAYSGDPGALVAQGTAESPIVITSNQAAPAAGDWYGLNFYNTTDDATTVLEYCTIEYAGYGTSGRAIYIYNASPTIANCTIRHSQGDGIYVTSSDPQITGNTISDCGRYGVYVASGAAQISNNSFANITSYDLYISNGAGLSVTGNTLSSGIYVNNGILTALTGNTLNYDDSHPLRLGADDVGPFLANNTVDNVTADSHIEVVAGTISRDATWPATMAYHITGIITVQGTDGADGITALTIAQGAELRFNRYQYLQVGGYSGDPGALVAQGSAAEPVLMTSNQPSPSAGDWGGIRFFNTSDDNTSRISHCVLEYAGFGNYGGIYTYLAGPTIDHTTIRHSTNYGIYISSGSPHIESCQISNTANYDICYYGTVGGALIATTLNTGLFMQANGDVAIDSNVINYNNAFPLKAYADQIGAIVSGSIFNNLDADSYIEVSGSTISRDAAWSAAMPYHITSYLIVQGTDGDDTVTTLSMEPGAVVRFNRHCYLQVGNSYGNPGALSAVGEWDQPIVFTSNQTTPAPGDWSGIRFSNTADDNLSRLAHCTVEYGGYGNYGNIYLYQASPEIHYSTIRNSSTYGIYINSATPIISANSISANSTYGIYNTTSANTVVAGNNWWGHSSGPYHESTNPSGQGDSVSDYVDYDPWATASDDKDGDGLEDNWEFANFGDLAIADGTGDYDNDGVLDSDEYLAGTDPKSPDSDGDGMPDGWEIAYGLNPLQNDALNDTDGDGATNIAEYVAGTSPTVSGDAANMTVEDFESGDFDLFYWISSNPENWGLSGARTYSGFFAAESYPISDSQSTTLETAINCNGNPVGFMFSISSQLSLDKLQFYIDGQLQDEWSGELPYTCAIYDVTAGHHDFKWVYTKDGAGAANQDTAWIDYIVFPGLPDSDGDSILDGWEYRYFNALDHDMSADSDSDGITDGDEYAQGTDPLVPN